MGNRRQARELALKALFYFDMEPDKDSEQLFEAFCSNFEDELLADIRVFFTDIVKGVQANRERIDTLLETYAIHWKISRMPVVDRNIMRIATYEFLAQPDIPASVSINEAVEIGKKYGTKESGAFINGVLDRIHRRDQIEPQK